MAILLGWQFTLAEFAGAPIMVALMALLFRRLLSRELVEQARKEAQTSAYQSSRPYTSSTRAFAADSACSSGSRSYPVRTPDSAVQNGVSVRYPGPSSLQEHSRSVAA
jgi:hypothetical protein